MSNKFVNQSVGFVKNNIINIMNNPYTLTRLITGFQGIWAWINGRYSEGK